MTPLYWMGYTLCNLVGKVAFDFKVALELAEALQATSRSQERAAQRSPA